MKKLDLAEQTYAALGRANAHAPYLIRVARAAQRYDSGIPGHAIKDFATGEHEADCAACALHAVLEEEA